MCYFQNRPNGTFLNLSACSSFYGYMSNYLKMQQCKTTTYYAHKFCGSGNWAGLSEEVLSLLCNDWASAGRLESWAWNGLKAQWLTCHS